MTQSEKLTLDQAVELLKKAVKYSEVKNQKHIDLSLVLAEERPSYQMALAVCTLEVEKGTITDQQLKAQLGLE